jgi:hypothetical protein
MTNHVHFVAVVDRGWPTGGVWNPVVSSVAKVENLTDRNLITTRKAAKTGPEKMVPCCPPKFAEIPLDEVGKRLEVPQKMDALDPEIFEALSNFETLPSCTESDVFMNLAILDKQYSSYPIYRYNVNGILVNIGADLRSLTVLSCAVKRLNDLIKDNPTEGLYWQLGTAYHRIADIKLGYPPDIELLMDSEELIRARNCYSMVHTGREYIVANTNSASILDKLSRNYEALLLYDRVLGRHPDFGMAMGNKAIALIYFFNISATGNPAVLFTARDLLRASLLRPETIEVGGQQTADHFQQVLNQLEAFLKRNQIPSTPKCEIALEEVPHHIRFFKEHEMFLNFCFECSICEVGLKDNVFPNLIAELTDQTAKKALAYGSFGKRVFFCLKILNHILEDFATARWIFLQAQEQQNNLSELDYLTKYVSTLDLTRNGSQFGLFKSVFSKLYGILDKVAFWVFSYYELQRKHIIFDDLLRAEVKERIIRDKNYQLLAVCSLARDFMDGGLYNRLRRTRNHVTHRFLDLGEVWSKSMIEDDTAEQFLTLNEFESFIFQMFSLVKAAVFYFLSGVRTDYFRKKSDEKGLIPIIHVGLQENLWRG